jgi:tetratricopeptide (TPR) repeat protein
MWRGDFSSPAPWLEEAILISRQLGDQSSEEGPLIILGILAHWQGNYQSAIAYYQEALVLCEKVGDHFSYLWAQVHMAYAVLRQGDIQRAREMFENGIRGMQKADLVIGLVFAVEGLASLNVKQEQYERAARLFAWADSMRDKIGDHRPPVEQASVEKDLAVIRANLIEAEFSKLAEEGSTMSMEQALALAEEK